MLRPNVYYKANISRVTRCSNIINHLIAEDSVVAYDNIRTLQNDKTGGSLRIKRSGGKLVTIKRCHQH